jgi:hypothetical protein
MREVSWSKRRLLFSFSSVLVCYRVCNDTSFGHRVLLCSVQLFNSKEAMRQQKAAMLEDEESLASLPFDADDSDADFIVEEDKVQAMRAPPASGAYLCTAPLSSSIT